MHQPGKVLIGTMSGLLVAVALSAAPAVQAQQRAAIRCESLDGQFNRCEVPWRDVELVQQESKDACIRDQSWGVDRQGLWVGRGCRGQFAEADYDRRSDRNDRRDDRYGNGNDRYGNGNDRDNRGGWQPGPDWDREIRLQCDSNGERYNLCQVDVGGHGHVRLISQQSKSRCTEDYSWGWNRAGVWVSHGCRGVFAVDRRW